MEQKYDEIIAVYKQKGCRVTEQRKLIVRMILENPGCSVKEIFYLANKKDKTVSRATVYRTIGSLEDFGYINRQAINLM